jgi:hypothetical protein
MDTDEGKKQVAKLKRIPMKGKKQVAKLKRLAARQI